MPRTFIRTPQACNTCRRRKTKCDGIRPRCGRCTTKHTQCIWSTPDSSFDPRSPTSELSNSVEQVDEADGKYMKGLQLCLKHFFERHFVSDFCSFDYPPDFEQKCKNDPLLSSSIISLCSRYMQPQDAQILFGLPSHREVSRHYLHRARSLAKETLDEPSVSHIQGNLILAMAELLSNSGSRHWLFAGSAIRMAEIMRLNKEFHQKHSLKDQEIRRRVFWACLLFDRALAYLLAKHRTIDLDTISIAVPGTDISLAYHEATKGLSLGELAAHQQPSELGLSSYLLKTVCLWSDLADFAVYSRRRLEWYPPTNPQSSFFIRNNALQTWIDSLPPSLCWSIENFNRQCVLRQESTYIAMQFLLHSASCVAHQCYLPHLPTYTKLSEDVDAAGLSYLHREEYLIQSCVSNALEAGEMLSYLMDPDRENHRSSLQTIWVASSSLIVAHVLLWLQNTQDALYSSDEIQQKVKHYLNLIHQLISSWQYEWKIARQWLIALNTMHDLYKAAYLGEINENILRPESMEPSQCFSDDDSTDFRPQPGDGYPLVVSLPNLQSSVKFATCDTSAKSISIQSIWLQLCGGWPYGFTGPECITDPQLNCSVPTGSTLIDH
ncbi:zinc finger transcription factor 1 [Talaromyces proteolyticus]|uniref:Zinc finger transcription factor 1 n=1 Tax=Talaromyces proteolyticus TaxID=1131652 RepID=A0AAD4KIA1_9EURO|nr:zinc finger transcription factor 1 [Talaromyces proteolyticus]KAH8690934.1 zinc finger transcription factor 1 [Talaromyces proteolyticus]